MRLAGRKSRAMLQRYGASAADATHIVWDVSASQLQPGIAVRTRHRCCTYTVSMT